MLAIDILAALVIAFSFFTIIPMPIIEWSKRRMKIVPLMMPVIGLIAGLISYVIYIFLLKFNFTPFFKAVIMCLYYVIFTGGLHIDGLSDAADAYFSRRDKAKKLEIMEDSNVGAFAVITLILFFITKVAVFNEMFSQGIKNSLILIFIPVISRLLQSSMIYLFKPAKPDGLARMYGDLDRRYSLIHLFLFVIITVVLYVLIGVQALMLIVVALAFYAIFYFSSRKQFGGITGDLLGAFLEISELIMLGTILFI